ncbi:MAG TPA: hypothetical protein VK970_12385 [Candidatus Methylacidiphilales bacterium]|nr:hypothetical protein [Candidatus Methylacidiphilales bacterium]
MRATFHTPAAKTLAFSLVEITIALGIISFSLVALLSLFSVGLNLSRQSSIDTALACMATRMAAEMTAQPSFDFATTYYFDGKSLPVANPSTPGIVYCCNLSTNLVTDTEMSGVSPQLRRVHITFSWPFPKNANTQTFYVTLPPP